MSIKKKKKLILILQFFNILIKPLTQMKHIYFFRSSRKSDKLSQITIFTNSVRKAYAMAQIHFIKAGYKGVPVKLAI